MVDIDAVIDTGISKKDRLTKKPDEKPLTGPISLLGLKDQQILFERLPEKTSEVLIKSSNNFSSNCTTLYQRTEILGIFGDFSIWRSTYYGIL